MYKVVLYKITGGNSVRTSTVEGMCVSLPKKGEAFNIVARPFVDGSVARVVSTSEVQEITEIDSGVIIKTLNSTYKVEVNNNAGKVFTDTH